MRNAAQAWEADFAERLESIGFVRGKSAPTTFYREASGCRCVVHGDDFTFLTYDDTGRQIVKDMEGWYDLKLRAVIGHDDEDDKEVTILNWKLNHVGHGLEYHVDERHEAEIRAEFGIDAGAKRQENPVEKRACRRTTRRMWTTLRSLFWRRGGTGQWRLAAIICRRTASTCSMPLRNPADRWRNRGRAAWRG